MPVTSMDYLCWFAHHNIHHLGYTSDDFRATVSVRPLNDRGNGALEPSERIAGGGHPRNLFKKEDDVW
jgi:hypothetical protein